MKLCFGTFARVLLLCSDAVEKKALLNAVVKSVDPTCNLTSNAVTGLLQCVTNLPGNRSNGLGDVVSAAAEADPRAVAAYFSNRIIKPLLNANKRKLAVLAILELIAQDESIDGGAIVEVVSGTTKNALLTQSTFVLSDFLAGIFLYTTKVGNKAGKVISDAVNNEFIQSAHFLKKFLQPFGC